jgi:hypothetical protein
VYLSSGGEQCLDLQGQQVVGTAGKKWPSTRKLIPTRF